MTPASADAAVVLSPHPDDAVLSAWSVLRRPAAVTVVNVCAGVPRPGPPPAWDRLTGARDSAERMRERLAEDAAALALAEREPVNLGFVDAQYRDAPVDEDALVEAIGAAVPEAVEVWAPAGLSAHPDHLQVREAALTIAPGRAASVRLYAELPYAVRRGWPEWVTGRPARRGLDLDAWLRALLPEGTGVPGTPHRLSRREARRKLRALRTYTTQWDAFDADGRLRDRRIIRYEASFEAPQAGVRV